jgi:hypothetical protein
VTLKIPRYHRADVRNVRTKEADQAFVGGVWRPTPSIVDWEAGNDDFVDEITEAQARAFAPEAFT